jgi:pyruvate formate lyase activating enzyme
VNLYQEQKNDVVKCLACFYYCQIPLGKKGICGVRKNIGKKLELLVYGRPCAVAVDPIKKKPLYHFMPGTKILSLGTFGCNFSCAFCQNWEISQNRLPTSDCGLLDECELWKPERVVKYAVENKIPSIAYTYNEPTIWAEYAMDIAKLAKEQGIKNVFVSNGYMSREARNYFAPYLDAINIDLKSFDKDFYQKICHAKLEPILDNIKYFYKRDVWLEITTLVIPNENDSIEELQKIAEFIAGIDKKIPWHISAFHADYKMNNKKPTSLEILIKAKEVGIKAGLKYVYIGNIF